MHSQLNSGWTVISAARCGPVRRDWPGVCTAAMRCRDPPCGVMHKTRTPQRGAAASRQIKAPKPCRLWTVAAGESYGVETVRGGV